MAIDVAERQSPGWWMQRLFKRLNDQKRRNRLKLLHDWYIGKPPLPDGMEHARTAFEAFMRQSRTNFARLVVSAMSHRMTPVGFRTAVDFDETGDAEAADAWKRAGLDVRAGEVHDLMLALGEAYVIVGEVDPETGAPLITAEDPRDMVGEPDPAVPWRLRAALKVVHDDLDEVDRAYLYLPGRVFVASRPNKVSTGPRLSFDPRYWTWDEERGGGEGQALKHDRIPVVRFPNKDEQGEFEPHLDLLTRINNVILQRMVIATLQAFRQRAAIGLPLVYPPGHPQAGEEIDYTQFFTMDPGAIWQLPSASSMWESGQVDLNGILSAAKDDIQQLSGVSETPMHVFMPAGQNQSAEGASMQRENLVFKCEDRDTRTGHPWARVMSLAFLTLEQPERADLAKLSTMWRSPARLSLAERADAATKAKDMPWRSRMRIIWEIPNDEIDRMWAERVDELMFEAQLAAQMQALFGQQQAPPQQPLAVTATTEPPQQEQGPGSPIPPIPTPDDVLADPLAGLPTPAGRGAEVT